MRSAVAIELSVFARVKDQRGATGMVRLGDTAHDNNMIASVVGRFEVALERGQCAFDDGHATVRQVHRHL